MGDTGRDGGTRKINTSQISIVISETIKGQHTSEKLWPVWVTGQLLRRQVAKKPTSLVSPKEMPTLFSRQQPLLSVHALPSLFIFI